MTPIKNVYFQDCTLLKNKVPKNGVSWPFREQFYKEIVFEHFNNLKNFFAPYRTSVQVSMDVIGSS